MRKAGLKALSVFFAASVLLSAAAVTDIGYDGYAYAEDNVVDDVVEDDVVEDDISEDNNIEDGISAVDAGEERVSGKFKYTVSNGEAEITGWATGEWELDVVDIPARIDGYPVVSIGENAFSNKMIRSLKLPQGLREIKSNAFRDVMTSIEVPETVTALSDRAFGDMMELHHGYLALPSSLEFEPNAYSPIRCTILRYHTENRRAVIDSYEVGDGTGDNLYVPETICSFDVQSVKEFTYYNDYSWLWENVKAVFCKNGVSLPKTDKVEVRYTPKGDGCNITSVVGNAPDLTLNLYDDINNKKITGISGVTAQLYAVSVPDGLTGGPNVSFPVLYVKTRSGYIDIVKIVLNSAESMTVSQYCYTALLPEDMVDKISFERDPNMVIYAETEDGIEIKDLVYNNSFMFFIPSVIDGKPVVSISDDCHKDFYSKDAHNELYIPSNIDSEEIRFTYKFVYTENSDSVSLTCYVIDSWASGGADFESMFGMPVDTVVTESGLWLGVNTSKDKNLIRYKKNANGNYEIIEIVQGDNTSTVTIPETIGGVPVSGFADSVLDDITDIIVPESLADSIPDTVEKVVYDIDEDGNFVITEASENSDVKFPESIGGSKVGTVIIEEDIKDKVNVPKTAAKIVYTEDEDGNVTITEIIPAQKDGKDLPVDIPMINGKVPELSEQAKKQFPHEHTGGTASCTEKAVCDYCGKEYGSLAAHDYNNGVCTKCGAKAPDAPSPGGTQRPGDTQRPEDPQYPEITVKPGNSSSAVVAEQLPENVTMKVTELSESSEIAEYLKKDPDWSLIKCFNIELFENGDRINSLDSNIRLRFEIPKAFRAEAREFAVLRIHGSSTNLLYDIDESDDTVTVETDKFSVYALVYRDADNTEPDTDSGAENEPDNIPGTPNNPDTGKAGVTWFILAGVLSASAVTFGRKKTR